MRPLLPRRIGLACALSLAAYALAFCLFLDRPLTLGSLAHDIEQKIARAGAIPPGNKLVILAGSNGPYSHRCEVMEEILARPCINAGVAVGIGLDYLFARWDPLLVAGDTLYLPMEPEQYTRTRAAAETGPDAAIMARHDRATLATLPPSRWLAAFFSFDLRAGIMSAIEMLLRATRFSDPRAAISGETNAWGDHIGHDAARATLNAAALRAMTPQPPDAKEIRAGHGAALIAAFTRRMQARGVRVIGGLSTGFLDAPLSLAAIAAIAAVYTDNGGFFLALPNLSRYPRADFFDSPEHLSEPYQIAHARAVALALAPLIGRSMTAESQ